MTQRRIVHHFVLKSSLWTAAEEGRGFYGGHKGSDDAGGAADIRGGGQRQQRQTTDRYTQTHTGSLHLSSGFDCR